MAELLPTDINKFKSLYKEKFGIELDDITARTQLAKLVRQTEIIYQPITQEQREELARRDAMKADAEALAQLIFDIYQDKKRRQSGKA